MYDQVVESFRDASQHSGMVRKPKIRARSAAVTSHTRDHRIRRPFRLVPRKREPTVAGQAPGSHMHLAHSRLRSPVLVTSAIGLYTSAGWASMYDSTV
jgi:hypothetical protein